VIKMSKIVVIGAGPAGIMAAITAANKHEVVLVEKNEKIGKKLFITGKGRCNVTNAKDINDFFDYIPGNPSFLYSALYSFTNEDTMNFFSNLGVKLKIERGERVFPESDKSSDIINALHSELINKGVTLTLNSSVKKVHAEGKIINHIELQDNSIIKGDYYIFCTGGLSYPRTGSTGDGLNFARKLGHNIIEPKPSLVPIVIEDEWVKELQGLSLKNVELRILNNNKVIYKDFGEMLFTHFGISGPIVLSASSVINKNLDLSAAINLKPALSYEELDKRIQKDFSIYANKAFKNALNDLFPSKLINVVVKLSGIEEDKKVNLITREERKTLTSLIQSFSMKISGLRPIEEAIVTAGGVDTKQIDPSTMKSKLIENMYFAGEVIDVDAYTGGYNIQIALSTGYLAGSRVGENE
jgi:predicted Rossmann fold flavoprotein